MKKLTLCLMLIASGFVHAETFFKDQSLSLLQGSDYELGDNERTVMTYEYLSVHDWGDVFGFVDRLHSMNDGGRETYIEVSPNFNIMNFENGFVNSIKVATTWEMSDLSDNLLLGLGAGLNVPGFSFFNASVYQRLNDSGEDNQQLTLTWGVPFNIAGQDFMFDGFMDHETELNDVTSTNFTPQLKWDISKLVGYGNKLYVGMEYVMWTNKFHSDGVDEENANLLIKAHF